MINKSIFTDSFDKVDEKAIAGIAAIAGMYTYRNGKKNNDGSVGEVRMSPKELKDLLAYLMLMGD